MLQAVMAMALKASQRAHRALSHEPCLIEPEIEPGCSTPSEDLSSPVLCQELSASLRERKAIVFSELLLRHVLQQEIM